jgi:hypothetical protein
MSHHTELQTEMMAELSTQKTGLSACTRTQRMYICVKTAESHVRLPHFTAYRCTQPNTDTYAQIMQMCYTQSYVLSLSLSLSLSMYVCMCLCNVCMYAFMYVCIYIDCESDFIRTNILEHSTCAKFHFIETPNVLLNKMRSRNLLSIL